MIEFLNLIDDIEEKERFRKLYEKYNRLVMWISYQKLNDNQLAEDCVQETFLYLAKNFGKIGDVDSKETKCYVSTIAQGIAISRYKKEQKIINYDESSISVPSLKMNEYDKIELSYIVDTLPDEDKNLLYLKYVFGYKSSEISKLYGISDALVRKRLERIRNQLKEIIGDE